MKGLIVFVGAALLAVAGAASAGTHYHAPKLKTYHYHAPKTYAPKIRPARVVPVRGYFKRDGTYVMPSHRTSPNATRLDNWSTKPNVNPYTGVPGTKDPYAPSSVH